jgi:hypothetical protein
MSYESKHEQIAAALRDHLAGIVGDGGINYWFTPGGVGRCLAWDPSYLDASLGHIILLRPGQELHREEANKMVQTDMEVWILVARKHSPTTENPFVEDAPTRWTLIDRAVRDVLKRIWDWMSSPALASLVLNIATEGIPVERDDYAAGWALVELHCVILYQYNRVAP